MLTHKPLRTKGKISLSRYFQQFEQGDTVAIVRDLAVQSSGFPARMQGRTGKVVGIRGSSYIVAIKDFAREKIFIVKPAHLQRIKNQ